MEVHKWTSGKWGRATCHFAGRVPPRPGAPAAHLRVYLALLPSGPDAVRRLKLHRVRAAVRPTSWSRRRLQQHVSVAWACACGQQGPAQPTGSAEAKVRLKPDPTHDKVRLKPDPTYKPDPTLRGQELASQPLV